MLLLPDHQLVAHDDQSCWGADVLILLVPLGCPLSPDDRPGIDTLGMAMLKGRRLEGALTGLC